MRRLLNLIFQLLAAALLIFIGTATWIVFDGITDLGEKADVALVTGHAEPPQGMHGLVERIQLDRVVKLYNDSEFRYIIVSGTTGSGTYDEPAAMAQYLESNGIPSSAIIEAPRAETMAEMARDVAAIMKSHQFESVMIVADYYHVTRTKLALSHEGGVEIQKAHVGKLHTGDALNIGREVIALYDYVGKTYLLPAAEKVKEEAKVGADKASKDAEAAKDKMGKSLDNLAK